jgi:putative hydrolase of the HAD superfamily
VLARRVLARRVLARRVLARRVLARRVLARRVLARREIVDRERAGREISGRREGSPVALKALLLDIDDTLVDTHYGFGVAMSAVFERWIPDLSGHRRQEAIAHWLADSSGHFSAYTRGETDFVTQRFRRAQELHTTFGGPVLTRDNFGTWDEHYLKAFASGWRLLPWARELVLWARQEGLAVGAVTNMVAVVQQEKLDRVGLADVLTLLVTMDTFGVGKPDPRVFHEACRLLGVEPENAAYLGDEPAVDAVGAKDAGLHGIWFNTKSLQQAPEGVHVVRSLVEVPDVLMAIG